MRKKLAINGGKKVRKDYFPSYNTVGEEEQKAAHRVLSSGALSKYLGCWHEDFYGGEEVRALEMEWASYFGAKHAIAVNSATSGLYCCVGASGAGPGDEIIVSPYTMSASAVAALVYNAIPIFADIEKDYFCLDPASVEERITERTKAIIVVDIFGQPYDRDAINAIAKKHNLLVIEDAAQAPGAKYKGKFAGTLGDMGVYSLNYHKHIQTGEGGVVVTDNDELAEKIRLIRNHAESVVEAKGHSDLVNMLGFNFRMNEIEAAFAREQLKKLQGLLIERQENIQYIEKRLEEIPILEMAKVREHCEHSYYVHPMKFKEEIAGVCREKFLDAVSAELMPMKLREKEGVKIAGGYVKPIYLQPMFAQQIVYGDKGCPFHCEKYGKTLNYSKGICPVCESMHFKELLSHEYMRPGMKKEDLDDFISALVKVWENIGELRNE